MSLPRSKKNRIVRMIRTQAEKILGTKELHSRCLWLAAATVHVLDLFGIRGVLQAGSASWPRIRREADDGLRDTHFSYLWDAEHPISKHYLMGGGPILARHGVTGGQLVPTLPEMHVWVGIPRTQEIVDVSTRELPQTCLMACGLPWERENPADYLWMTAEQCPDWTIYAVDPVATQLAGKLLSLMDTYKKEDMTVVKLTYRDGGAAALGQDDAGPGAEQTVRLPDRLPGRGAAGPARPALRDECGADRVGDRADDGPQPVRGGP